MEIGEIPIKEEKDSSIPKNLFVVEFTAYNQFSRQTVFLENSKEIKSYFFSQNHCLTAEYHYVGHFVIINDPKNYKSSDGFLITYFMYEEAFVYFAHVSDETEAKEVVRNNVHKGVEIVNLNRFNFIKEWRNELKQPFVLPLVYFKPEYLRSLM